MLKVMRRRVILAAMAAFAAVILLIGTLVNVVNYGVVTRRADETLNAILLYEAGPDKDAPAPPDGEALSEPGGHMSPKPFLGLPDQELNYMTRFFVVRLDGNGNYTNVFTEFIASIDEDEAKVYAQKAFAARSEHGYIGEYRYVKTVKDGETIIAFLNTLREQQNLKSLLMLTLVISGVSLLIVFILVVLLSRRAIRPIANNIKQQKQFITDASHELKTPLTSISTSLDVLEMEKGQDEWTENIRKQTGRLSKLVNELVILSKLDEETPLPNKEQFSLSNAAWEIVEIYKTQAKAAGKKLETNIEEDVNMFGEKAAIQQMLSVLMDNAIRYSDEGGDIRLTVNKKKNRAMIEVFNTCDYSTPPDVNRLFDRFYRPDNSRSSATGGTGVGLAIAKAVVETHHGRISAECPSGKTMTFKITL